MFFAGLSHTAHPIHLTPLNAFPNTTERRTVS